MYFSFFASSAIKCIEYVYLEYFYLAVKNEVH